MREVKLPKRWRKRFGLKDGELFYRADTIDDVESIKSTKDAGDELCRSFRGKISTDAPDADCEVLVPRGADLSTFEKNPVAFFAHGWRDMPIGNWRDWDVSLHHIKSTFDALVAPPDHPKEASWFPNEVAHCLRSKVLRGISVGFSRLEQSPPTEKELEANESWRAGKVQNVLRRWKLLEASIVPLPCNTEALVQEQAKGMLSEELASLFKAPTSLSLKADHWAAAIAHLKGECDEFELDEAGEGEQVHAILAILTQQGLTSDLFKAAAQLEQAFKSLEQLRVDSAREVRSLTDQLHTQAASVASQLSLARFDAARTAATETLAAIDARFALAIARATGDLY